MLRRLLSFSTLLTVVVVVAAGAVAVACADDHAPVVVVGSARVAVVDAGVTATIPAAVVADDLEPPVPTLLEREALAIETGDLVDHRRFGEQLLRDGRSMDAIGELRKTLAVDASADVWSALGDAYLRVGDVERGVDCLQEAVTLDVDHLASRRLLTRRYLSANDGTLARQQAEEWVRLEPQAAASRQALGRSFSQLGMWREAIAQFNLVLVDQPDNAYAHNNLGFAALQIGDNELAVVHLQQILGLRPHEGYMLNNLGVAYERSGRAAEAHASFARAAELSPRYAQAALNRDRLQHGLDQAQRIVSAGTLLKLREGDVSEVAFVGRNDAMTVDLPAMPTTTGE